MAPGHVLLMIAFCVSLFSCDGGSRTDTKDTERTKIQSDTTGSHPEGDFDLLVSDYENEYRLIWQKPELVIQLLGDLDGKTVADIGAGTGYFAFRLLPGSEKVIAVDIDPRAVAYMDSVRQDLPAQLQAKMEVREALPDNPGIGPQAVDVVLLVNTYMYLKDRVGYFRRLKSGLRPGAVILIIDFKKKTMPIGPPLEEKLELALVEQELRDAGYRILLSDDTTLDYQYIIKAGN